MYWISEQEFCGIMEGFPVRDLEVRFSPLQKPPRLVPILISPEWEGVDEGVRNNRAWKHIVEAENRAGRDYCGALEFLVCAAPSEALDETRLTEPPFP